MLSRVHATKSRETKLHVEREREVTKRGVHSTNSTALGVLRRPSEFESQLCQLAVSPRKSC